MEIVYKPLSLLHRSSVSGAAICKLTSRWRSLILLLFDGSKAARQTGMAIVILFLFYLLYPRVHWCVDGQAYNSRVFVG